MFRVRVTEGKSYLKEPDDGWTFAISNPMYVGVHEPRKYQHMKDEDYSKDLKVGVSNKVWTMKFVQKIPGKKVYVERCGQRGLDRFGRCGRLMTLR